MTQPRGRTDNGPTPRRILAAVLAPIAALAACAGPATEQPSGTSPTPAALSEPPPGPATAWCAQEPQVTEGSPEPGQSPVDEATQRRAAEVLQKMAEESAPLVRGTLPAAARTSATACVDSIRRDLSLYDGGLDGRVPDAATMRDLLESAGLERITVRSRGRYDAGTPEGLVFSGWTGQACVYGGLVSAGPDIRIGQPFADGACLPPA